MISSTLARRGRRITPAQLQTAIDRMFPGLLVRSLPGETAEEARARHDAAWDILDDLLTEAVTA